MATLNGMRAGLRRPKIINDALHGIIDIGGRCLQILDTHQYQRMRHIHQLQASLYVYPTAQHTRLEHSLGTYHLAGMVLHKLQRKQPELEIDDHDIEMVQMAALCHDIGHGMFSHMLDYTIFPAVSFGSEFTWMHEQRSCEILEYLIDDNHIDVSSDELKTVQSLIHPEHPRTGGYSKAPEGPQLEKEKRFLWDVVANSRTGVDVDKFDYLVRDSRETGIKISFDHFRVMELMKVVDNEICFNSRGVENVYDMFHARSRLYRQCYFHKATRAVERMIADAILAANHVLKLQDYIGNVEEFCKLDDSILREINRSKDPSLVESQKIIRRIEQRDLYKFVDEFTVPPNAVASFSEVKLDDILQHKSSEVVKAEDLVVENLKIDYGRGNNNPVDSVGFFDDRERNLKKYTISRDRVSSLIPRNYRDVTVCLYIKKRDAHLEDEARATFVAYQKKTFGREVMRTPSLKRKASEDGDEEEEEIFLSQTGPSPQSAERPTKRELSMNSQ